MEKGLYAVLLGGKLTSNQLMEDHQLVFVVAEDEEVARKLAKEKWKAESVHVDGTQLINTVDGYQIHLEKKNDLKDSFKINPDYSK